jgi:DNA-binding SARP family transcriptional activator
MPNALGIGLLGPLQVWDETGRPVHVGGRQLRVLLTLLALNAGRVVPVGSLAGELWPDDPPGNPGNALQTLVSRLRAELRQAEAIAAYHEGRELLADQLGVDPSAQLEQVYLGILRGPAASRERSGAVAKPPARAHDDPERAAVPAQEPHSRVMSWPPARG